VLIETHIPHQLNIIDPINKFLVSLPLLNLDAIAPSQILAPKTEIVTPDFFLIAGWTNRQQVTKAETGFPGKPKYKQFGNVATVKGFPGVIATDLI
jgi:hypothetical protein